MVKNKFFVSLLILLAFQPFAGSAAKLNDLGIERMAQGTCGTLATAMTERVYNTNKEMKKEYYKTPVFDKSTDFEMMRHLKLLATESEKFTDTTPDTKRLSSMLKAFEILRKKYKGYVKDCLAVYRPVTKQCHATYERSDKGNADTCQRAAIDQSAELDFIKKHFLRLK